MSIPFLTTEARPLNEAIYEWLYPGKCAHHWVKEKPLKPFDKKGNSMMICLKCSRRSPAREANNVSDYVGNTDAALKLVVELESRGWSWVANYDADSRMHSWSWGKKGLHFGSTQATLSEAISAATWGLNTVLKVTAND